MPAKKIIGVVGGLGPFAGYDLLKKIFNQTIAFKDQDHLPVIMLSMPSTVPDRTEFLLGKGRVNPAKGIIEIIYMLEKCGCAVAGIPCNTSHAPVIFNKIVTSIKKEKLKINLLNMPQEVCLFLKQSFPHIENVGVLATTGTVNSRLYDDYLLPLGLTPVYPEDSYQTSLHEAIYNTKWGLKAFSDPAKEPAVQIILDVIDHVINKRVEAIILGCTELPLAVKKNQYQGIPLIDSTLILSRALIRESNDTQLKEYSLKD